MNELGDLEGTLFSSEHKLQFSHCKLVYGAAMAPIVQIIRSAVVEISLPCRVLPADE